MMEELGLGKGRHVQSDGAILVMTPEHCDTGDLMDHDERYLHPLNRNYIRRYLIRRPLGYALLLGSSRYNVEEQPLDCVEKDLKEMGAVLREGGWAVHAPHGSATTISGYQQELEKLKTSNLENYSCFMFYFSGHGSQEGIRLQPDGHCVPFMAVVNDVVKLTGLLGKPKIIIFDCCRTDRCVEGFNPLNCKDFATNYCDTIVCYACSSNNVSIALGKQHGSIFTQIFAKKLQQLGRRMSFVELLNQARGETYHVTKLRFKMGQQPISESSLNCQLLLKETQLSEANREKVKRGITQQSIVLVPLNPSVETKGPWNDSAQESLQVHNSILATPTQETARPTPKVATPTDTPLHELTRNSDPLSKPTPLLPTSMEDSLHDQVVTDRVIPGKRKFTSREEVVSNVPSLGQGHHVFICYLPDPATPYGSPDTARVESNLDSITRLHCDLTQHGFTVTSDLSLADQQPMNVLQWYVRHIERCDHVILVCSTAFKELFSSSRPQRHVTDPKAERFLVYSTAIYAECDRCVRNGVGKFIPVVLDPEWLDRDKSVPLLFQCSQIYDLCEKYARAFDYDNTSRDFESLVCRMVGIDRHAMNAPKPGAPITFPSYSSVEAANRQKYLAQARSPRPGYRTVPSRVGQLTGESSAGAQPTNHHITPPYYQAPPSVRQTTGGAVNWGVTTEREVYQLSPATPGPTAGLPSTEESTLTHSQRQYVATHYAATPSPSHPTPSQLQPHYPSPHHPAPAATTTTTTTTTTTNSDPSSSSLLPLLPLTTPPRNLLLWLSDQVVQWKFLGRYLDVEETVLERIVLENQNNVREQCFQMLRAFAQMKGSEGTCRRLGEALLQSEKNRHLFAEFCAKVDEVSHNHE